jgi:acid phosphatase (class A)
LTAKLFKRLTDDLIPIVQAEKTVWNRPRPYLLSPEIKSCFGDLGDGSYPSGHTMFAYACAVVLSNMIPERKTEIFERAAQYGKSRMICGVHYPSDVEAGRVAGTVLAAFALQNPEFRKEFNEAKKEVRGVLGLK